MRLVLEHGLDLIEGAVATLGNPIAVFIKAPHDTAMTGLYVCAIALSVWLAGKQNLSCRFCLADECTAGW